MNARRFSFAAALFFGAACALAGCDTNPRNVGSSTPGNHTGEFPSENRLDESHIEGDKIGLKGPLAAPEKKKEAGEHAAAGGGAAAEHAPAGHAPAPAHPAGSAAPAGEHH